MDEKEIKDKAEKITRISSTIFDAQKILSIVTAVATIAATFFTYDKRIAVLETTQIHHKEVIAEIKRSCEKTQDILRKIEPELNSCQKDIQNLEKDVEKIDTQK